MTNKEAIERWATQIIPTVFRVEQALKEAKPEWNERLKTCKPEDAKEMLDEYCHEIATIIVKHAVDYEPDGSIDGEMDYIENT